ncbi:MAG TPA: DEAD/DEAH box helicase [Longimicrobiales bacterium]|nr:DEAD/DEAH box helicase [Longimicrobiales bacterium]
MSDRNMKFDELTSAPAILRAIRELGWEEPTPIQQKAIPIARTGCDMVGIAQTGTGKTASFLLPALEKQGDREGLHTLILCPTRELAQQVAADARVLSQHLHLFVGELVGGLPIRQQIRDLRAGFDLVVATPGRLIDHLERGTIDLSEIETLVLDEADRMLDMGFRPQIDEILRQVPKQRQTLFFSATMPNGVHALALRILNDPVWVEVARPNTAATGIEQQVYSVRQEKKVELLLELLAQPDWDQVLVFTRTKHGADILGGQLKRAKVSSTVLHGDRDMKERRRALDEFDRGHVRVLVATDVAQRGLDIEGISHVVNFDVPQDPEDYIHRIGRTGRAGATGTAVTFMSGGDLAQVHDIERLLGYKLERISLEAYDYTGGTAQGSARPRVQVNRAGNRLGSRSASDLSPEELQKLLKVG